MTGMLAARWQVLDSGAADGVTNMAVDSALLDIARSEHIATLRIYGWSTPTLSLGRHERARGRFDQARLAAAGVDVVRRVTGGRALLHDHEVTYSIAAPTSAGPLRERYATINALLTDALARLAVSVATVPDKAPTVRPGRSACFAEPNAGELVLDGAKLVASAQVEDDGAFLQHGSILLEDDQPRIAAFVSEGDFPPTKAASLNAILGRDVAYAEVRDALTAALTDHLATAGVTSPAVARSLYGESRTGLPDKYRAKFLDPEWTWRR